MSERIAFIQSYLSDKERVDNEGHYIPDKPTRGCILASAELFRKRKVDKIALSVAPELSKPIVKRLHGLLPNSLTDEDIVSTESTVTTAGEIREIKRLMEENNWERVVAICIEPHKDRVDGTVNKIFREQINKPTVTFNQVLESIGGRYKDITEKSNLWKETRKFTKQEKYASYLLKIPFIGPFIVHYLPDRLPGKVDFQKKLIATIGGDK